MTTVYPCPIGGGIRLDQIAALSSQFAEGISAAIGKFNDTPTKWPWPRGSVRSSLADFVRSFAGILDSLPASIRSEICRVGLAAFTDRAMWAETERVILLADGIPGQRSAVLNALAMLCALDRDAPDLTSPSVLKLRRGQTSLRLMYEVSALFVLQYADLLRMHDARSTIESSSMVLRRQSSELLRVLIGDAHCRVLLANKGFDAFADHPKLFDKLREADTWAGAGSISKLLELHNAERWAPRVLTVYGHSANLSQLYEISITLYNDVARYAASIGQSAAPRGVKGQTARDTLTGVQRAIVEILPRLQPSEAEDLKAKGFVVFTHHDSALLVRIHKQKWSDQDMVRWVKDVVDRLFPAAQLDRKDLLPYQLRFRSAYSPRPLYCDFSQIRSISQPLYDDLETLLAKLSDVGVQSISDRTIYTHYTQIKAIFVLIHPNLDAQAVQAIESHGMAAFGLDGCRLQKIVLANLQNASKIGTLSNITAKSYRSTFRWVIKQFGHHVVDAYPISTSRTEQHKRRLNTDDYYSAEQCREIAFHVEALLNDSSISATDRLALMLARVLLKTGWNLSPTLGIECDDIIQVPKPLNPSGTVAVVLQKARAGYRSDTYTFDDPSGTSASAMRSASQDLIQIRDELTAGLRGRLPDSNPYKNYIFLLERRGVAQRLPADAPKSLSYLLKKRGCNLTFDSKKIRKGGVNHLYRQVQKDVAAYEAAAKHDFKTFESTYLRIDENQARYTLGRAVEVMGRYFGGKEISAEIVILTEADTSLQRTPTGGCGSTGGDAEAARYGAEHKKLLSERRSEARFCADFLSCIWCKFFRIVADPEHVWKLLSYREYVLKSMEASVLEADTTDDQQANIDILDRRVQEMLERLDALTPGVRKAGQDLLATHGMHSDWEFVIADLPKARNWRD